MSLVDVHPWSTVSNQWHSSGRLNCSAVSDCFSVTSSLRAQWLTFSSPSCCGTYAWWYPVNPIYLMSALCDTRGLLLYLQTNSLTTFIMTITLILTNSLTLIDILLLDDCLLDTTRYSLAADLFGIAPVHRPQFLQVTSLYPWYSIPTFIASSSSWNQTLFPVCIYL